MFRRAALAAGLIVVLGISGLWIRERLAERCPEVGAARPIAASVTATDAWRFADVTVGSMHWSIEPQVTADFGAYIRPVPLPQSHPVAVGITVKASEPDTVRAWRTTCLRLVRGRESVTRPAASDGDLITSGGHPAFYYRFDGADGFPEWPPGDTVDIEIVFVVDGSPYLLQLPSVPIGSMG